MPACVCVSVSAWLMKIGSASSKWARPFSWVSERPHNIYVHVNGEGDRRISTQSRSVNLSVVFVGNSKQELAYGILHMT